MDKKRVVWQISGGPTDRSYADVFLKYGVALIGPGDAGAWAPERDDHDFEGGFVRRFAQEVQIGDAFLLRSGASTIRAIGLVASDYVYLPQFDDVNGWDLQHGRRVRWCDLPSEYGFETRVFGANPPRVTRVGNPEVLSYAKRFINSPPTHWQAAPLPSLPDEEPLLAKVPPFLEDMVAGVQDLAKLYWDRKAFGDLPREDELVAHYVVPLLQLLGWPVEKIGVKWRDVDVCVFRELPRDPENCHFIIEAKRLGSGVEGALEQAKGYMKNLGVFRDIVVTDGIRYRMYGAEKDYASRAYANLASLKPSGLDLFSLMRAS
jgi:hypothetical protein